MNSARRAAGVCDHAQDQGGSIDEYRVRYVLSECCVFRVWNQHAKSREDYPANARKINGVINVRRTSAQGLNPWVHGRTHRGGSGCLLLRFLNNWSISWGEGGIVFCKAPSFELMGAPITMWLTYIYPMRPTIPTHKPEGVELAPLYLYQALIDRWRWYESNKWM